jgi:hypothetical protein
MKQQKTETEALINRYCLILVVSLTGVSIMTKRATKALLPLSKLYLCEAGFSVINMMKSKNRSQLQTLEEDLRVCLSTI